MNNFDKVKITEIIYNQLKDKLSSDTTVDKLLRIYWYTGKSSSNLRLTEEGKFAFDLLNIEFYEYPLKLEKQQFIPYVTSIGKKLKSPFYVGLKNQMYKSAYIRIYDSKIAMLVNLYGSFADYINATNY